MPDAARPPAGAVLGGVRAGVDHGPHRRGRARHGTVDQPVDKQRIQALQTLATQAGNRLGMLRVMAETQLQASTDGLTGLTNRRSFENRLRKLRGDGVPFVFVMADLDHFKVLNDTNGHEAGDKALRIFAEALRRELRSDDVACRYGGEEFAIALPGAEVPEAVEAMGRVREALVPARVALGRPGLHRQLRSVALERGRATSTTSCSGPTPRCSPPRTWVGTASASTGTRPGLGDADRPELTRRVGAPAAP